jgi:fumarate reductase subunit C
LGYGRYREVRILDTLVEERNARPESTPAWLDFVQGASGLFLVLFMWAHMFMVSSILLGADAMYFVTRLFEGEPIFGRRMPILVSLIAAIVLAAFIIHAVAAIRKMPAGFDEWRAFRRHASVFRHADTALWLIQVITGFILMFLAVAHLYQMLVHPADIGPYASADRVWSGRWWPFYLVLLFAVELHAGIGIYRLAVKWGWLADRHGNLPRERLIRAKWVLTAFFLGLGLLTLAAYMKIGYEHRDRVGERYEPAAAVVAPIPYVAV